MQAPHIAVIGAGAFGGWTALHLLRKGCRVSLFDSWGPGHSRASSGGETRLIRAVYGSDRIYTEWVARSFPLWQELEEQTGDRLYYETGSLFLFSQQEDRYARQAISVLQESGLHLEEQPVEEMAGRYPQIDFSDVRTVFFEPKAGVLKARLGCRKVVERFVALGGDYRQLSVQPGRIGEGLMDAIRFSDGDSLSADAYVFACGPWLPGLFPALFQNRINITRQEIYYFGVPDRDHRYNYPHLPVWIDFGERIRYGVPDIDGRGFKFADDTREEPIDPDTSDRLPVLSRIERARAYLGRRFPGLKAAPLTEARVCQYTNSPDGHFLIDRHPEAENVWLAGLGCGHAYKMGPAIGEYLSRCIMSEDPVLSTFSLSRISGGQTQKTQFD